MLYSIDLSFVLQTFSITTLPNSGLVQFVLVTYVHSFRHKDSILNLSKPLYHSYKVITLTNVFDMSVPIWHVCPNIFLWLKGKFYLLMLLQNTLGKFHNVKATI